MIKELKIGDTAPSFCLPDRNEKEVCLSDFRGKYLILYFYPKDNTSGCTLEAVTFTEYLEDFKKENAEIIGISPDSCGSHTNFISKHGLKIILISDTEKEIIKKYGAWTLKKMYGREYYGVNRSTFIINPEGGIEYIERKVKVKGHIENILSKLKELKD